jgi:hypothetical protein
LHYLNIIHQPVYFFVVVGDLFAGLVFAFGDKYMLGMFLSFERRFLTVRPELAWLVAVVDNWSE